MLYYFCQAYAQVWFLHPFWQHFNDIKDKSRQPMPIAQWLSATSGASLHPNVPLTSSLCLSCQNTLHTCMQLQCIQPYICHEHAKRPHTSNIFREGMLSAYCKLSYFKPSSCQFGSFSVFSQLRLQQGDNLGSLLFCLPSIHHVLKNLLVTLTFNYHDDFTLTHKEHLSKHRSHRKGVQTFQIILNSKNKKPFTKTEKQKPNRSIQRISFVRHTIKHSASQPLLFVAHYKYLTASTEHVKRCYNFLLMNLFSY